MKGHSPVRAAAFFLLLSGPALAATAFVEVAPRTGSFRIGNGLVERDLKLGADGRFSTRAFRDLPRGKDWAPTSVLSGEFRIVGRFLDAAGASGSEWSGVSGWSLAGVETSVSPDGVADLAVALRSSDPAAPLDVTLHYRCFPESPAIRTWLDARNGGGGTLLLEAADSFALALQPPASPASLFWVRNFTWAHADDAFTTRTVTLEPGVVQHLLTGPFGTDAAWMAVTSRPGGAGVFAAWEWSGTGDFSAEAAEDGTLRLRGGLSAAAFRHTLGPGESFTTPAGIVGFFTGGTEGAGGATRRLVESRYSLPAPDPDFPWVGFDTWGYDRDIDETLVHRLVDEAADLGAEYFTLDYGWMARLGDWVPRPGAFDGGIEAIADHVHARGMKLALWMSLGSVDASSRVLARHPEWAATVKGQRLLGDYGDVALCLADPDVQAWDLAEVDRIVSTYHVDWIVHDFQVITRCDAEGHGHQAGDGEWAETRGYYAILDEIHRRHPALVLENCWDGGNMIDLGMSSRHHTTVLCDQNSAFGNRRAVYGASYVLPIRYLGKYVGDDGSAGSYRFLSALPGGAYCLMGRPTEWDASTRAAARSAVALFKTLRPILRDGEFHHLTPGPRPDAWDAVMSYEPATGTGAAFASRNGRALPRHAVRPAGLDPAATYRVDVVDGEWLFSTVSDEAAPYEVQADGLDLYRKGVRLSLVEDDDCAVLRFQRLTPP